MSETLIKVPGYKIPGYQIEREIGRGGMATVYLALQESLSRHVALKVMNPVLTTDEDFKTRFLNEGHIVGQLSHSNIVTVFDIGAHENHYYLSMELLRGGSLREKIQQTLPLNQALTIAKALANALGYAHQRGFIHRDIKPPNVLFREDGSPVLTDFGIAKALGSSGQLTRTGYAFGSVGYMSPEQSLGKGIDHRADLYSFGVMFWEMLTSQRLYESPDAFALALKHATAPIPALPESYQVFQPLLQKLLAKQPEERYENAEQLVEELDRLQYDLELTDLSTARPRTKPNDTTVIQAAVTREDEATRLRTAANTAKAAVVDVPENSAEGGSGAKIAIIAVVLLALVGGGYYYLQLNSSATSTNDPELVTPEPVTPEPQQQIATLLQQAKEHFDAGRYTATIGGSSAANAFSDYTAVLGLDSDNTEARQALAELGRITAAYRFLSEAQNLYQQNDLPAALTAVDRGLRLQPQNAVLLALKKDIESAQTENTTTTQTDSEPQQLTIEQLLAQASTQADLGKRFEPPGDNAFETYQQVLQQDSSNETARQALIELGRMRQIRSLLQRATELLEQGKTKQSLALIEAGLKIAPQNAELLQLRRAAQSTE